MGLVETVLQTIYELVGPNFLCIGVGRGDPTFVLLVANTSAVRQKNCLIVAFVAGGLVLATVAIVSARLTKTLEISEIARFAYGAGGGGVTNSTVICTEDFAVLTIYEVSLVSAGDTG